MDYLEAMTALPLFSTFTKDALRSYLTLYSYSITKYPQGAVIFNEGEACTSIFIILEGSVRIQKIDSSGRYFNVGDAHVGEMMGPNVLFSLHSTYPLSTMALSEVTLLSLSKELVLKLCQVNVHFLESLLRIASSKAFMLTRRLDEVTIQTLKQNLSRFLLQAKEAQGLDTITLPFTKKAWAEELGVQRPSLQRELRRMEDLGAILVARDRITILDAKRLEDLAEQ
ncbi:hypothetical protein ABB02_00036 [Clostridiaceae bacterium JG1575]|nr:hypothetical protein ABB02_00036 [Clostridiaceae bacterium JG1575]